MTKSSSSSANRPSPPAKEPRSAAAAHAHDDDGGADAQSEAETIVLPGKDGHSPSKTRKVIKHEDKGDGDMIRADPSGSRKQSGAGAGDRGERASSARDGGQAEGATSSLAGKKKRLHEKQRSKDGSSGLSSAPASPPPHRRRRLSNAHSGTDSDAAQPKSPKASSKDKARSLEKFVPHKRKAARAESDDEADSRKARRQRTSGASVDVGHPAKPGKDHHRPSLSRPHHEAQQASRPRSVSPQPRGHRRSISTQLPSHSNGMSHKKKRIPAPLQSTDYHSDESSASGSPHIRSSKLRSLTTPATAESTISPAKLAPHKKHLDAHGQTFLARACARGEYDHAKQRLGERPEDLNVADFAGNTPLQIASINGYADIVKLLVEAGCNLECVNYDKDTPLLDAVDNGHLDVVKILLEAGVNPRKANVNGEEPLDRVSDDLENAGEIRTALIEAKKRMGERRLTSEEHHEMDEGRYSYGPDSPRRSPAAPSSAAAASSTRRNATVRATKTSNHLLYMPMDDKTLRQAAGRGDEETVTRILQVRDTFDDPESMVAAARGGHDLVMQLLLALGSANPDPPPVSSMPREHATPMLAAIGQENTKVIRLLLDQTNFDPTRRFLGETYHEIARRRQGPNWKDEEQMLKEAYDAYRKSHKDTATTKTKSPARRDQDRESKRASRAEQKDEVAARAAAHKRKLSSPSREAKKPAGSTKPNTSPKEKRRSNSFSTHTDDPTSPKRGPGRVRKEDRIPAIAISDREISPSTVKLASKPKRTESDLAAVSSEGETVKPRRKLVSGRELKGEREKNRRASMVSTASSMREPSSPRDGRHDEAPERQKSEKYHDRTKQLKRDESRDRLPVGSESSGKRHRASATPPLHGSADKESDGGPLKRRRLDTDGKEKKQKVGSSPDRPPRSGLSREAVTKPNQKDRDDDDRKGPTSTKLKKRDASSDDRGRRESGKSLTSEKSIHVKSEDMDLDMPDADQQAAEEAEAAARAQREKEEKKKQAEAEARALEAKKKEEEAKRKREEEEAKRKEEEAKRKAEEEEKKKRKEEEEERERKRREAEEQERKRKEEEERARREEEERLRREEEEKRRREEEEKKRKEEEERRKREEEERLRREQLEREAAEEARRRREEEERKEQERRERLQREEMERRRAAREAEQRRIFEEQERLRLDKLPPLLRWLDRSANPKTPEVAEKFSLMQGVRYDCIRPQATGTPDGREQWLLNTQVALLLGEKDLELSRYTAWERIPVSMVAKRIIWRLESDRYALTRPSLYDIGRQLLGYYGEEDPETMRYKVVEKLRGDAWERFASMNMFFVKVCDPILPPPPLSLTPLLSRSRVFELWTGTNRLDN